MTNPKIAVPATHASTPIETTLYSGAKNVWPSQVVVSPDFATLCDDIETLLLPVVAYDSPPLPDETETERRKRIKATLPYLSPARLREGKPRLDANVDAVTALFSDFDRCNLDALISCLFDLGLAAAIYTSPSDDPEGPADARRVRVLAPVSREITPAECEHTRLAFAELVGLAPGCGADGVPAESVGFFVGQMPGTSAREFYRFEGGAVDVDALMARPLLHTWGTRTASESDAPKVDKSPLPPIGEVEPRDEPVLAALLAMQPPPGVPGNKRRMLLRATGSYLADRGLGDERIAAVVSRIPTVRGPQVCVKEAIDGARDRRAGVEHVAGWKMLKARDAAAAAALERATETPWARAARERSERDAKAEAEVKAHKPAAGSADAGPDPLLSHGRMVDRAKPPPPLVYVIEGLDLAQGKVSAVQAFANVAKTPFALLMAICVASGKPFLGHEVQQRNAMFLAFEGGILTEEREARLCAGLGLERTAVPLHFMHVDSAISEELLVALATYIEKHSIGFVAIDTYGSALPGDIEHNSDKFSYWLKQLGKLSDLTGALIVVLLHENKSESAKGMRKMSGHNSAPGAIQAAIGLERTSDDRTLIDVYCSREVRKAFAPFRVQFKDVACADAPTGLSLVAERRAAPGAVDAKDARPQNQQASAEAEQKTRVAGERLWKLLREGNQAHTTKELVAVGGEGLRPGERALARLREAGLVSYVGGKYCVSPDGAAAGPAKVKAALAGLRGEGRGWDAFRKEGTGSA